MRCSRLARRWAACATDTAANANTAVTSRVLLPPLLPLLLLLLVLVLVVRGRGRRHFIEHRNKIQGRVEGALDGL